MKNRCDRGLTLRNESSSRSLSNHSQELLLVQESVGLSLLRMSRRFSLKVLKAINLMSLINLSICQINRQPGPKTYIMSTKRETIRSKYKWTTAIQRKSASPSFLRSETPLFARR